MSEVVIVSNSDDLCMIFNHYRCGISTNAQRANEKDAIAPYLRIGTRLTTNGLTVAKNRLYEAHDSRRKRSRDELARIVADSAGNPR